MVLEHQVGPLNPSHQDSLSSPQHQNLLSIQEIRDFQAVLLDQEDLLFH